MKNNIAILFGMVLSCMVCSCTNGNNGREKSDGGFSAKTGEAVRDSNISHARYFSVSECGNYTAVDVKDPWNGGAVAATYYVVYNDSVQTPSDGYKIKVPVKNIALNSCSHIGFTDMLGCIDKVIGMSSAKYVYNSNLRRRIAAGDCVDIGDSFALNFEKTATLPVEAVMVTLYNNPDKNIDRLIQTGIPVIYNVEWMEPDILGRAEWIKFFGVFYDRKIKGLWVTADGIVYADFNRNIHVIDDDKVPDKKEFVRFFCGVDWGYEHKGAIVLFGVTKDGKEYILRVTAAAHMLIDWWIEQARGIIREYGYGIKFYCDSARPDNINEFRKANIWAVDANKAVNAGVECVAGKLKKKQLFVRRSQSQEFCAEIYAYVWDKRTGQPVKVKDDIMDAVRYGVYSDAEDHKYGENAYAV